MSDSIITNLGKVLSAVRLSGINISKIGIDAKSGEIELTVIAEGTAKDGTKLLQNLVDMLEHLRSRAHSRWHITRFSIEETHENNKVRIHVKIMEKPSSNIWVEIQTR